MTRMLAGPLAALGLALAATTGAAFPITTCDTTIPTSQRGVLQADLDCHQVCSADPATSCDGLDPGDACAPGKGVCRASRLVVEHGGTLDLDGHVVNFVYQGAGALCGTSSAERGRCTIEGPGTLQGGKGTGIAGRSMDVIVRNVTISFTDGAITTRGHLSADGLVVPHDRENSVYAAKGMTLKNVRFDGESGLFTDGDVTCANVVLGPHGARIVAGGRVRGHHVTLGGYSDVIATNVVLRHVSSAPSPGPDGELGSQVSASHRLRLVDADVVAIESGKAPRLIRSTCDTSSVAGSSASWGVCTND
jgi:hypothetical protein